jgi:hypothetical protein
MHIGQLDCVLCRDRGQTIASGLNASKTQAKSWLGKLYAVTLSMDYIGPNPKSLGMRRNSDAKSIEERYKEMPCLFFNFKGSLTRDFRLQVFFMNQCPPGPQVFHWSHFEFFRKFAEIFAN